MTDRIRPTRTFGRGVIFALIMTALSAAPLAAQTDYYWSAPTGGAGNWDLATPNWSTAAGGPLNYTWLSSGNERANFGGTGGTVNLAAGGITAYGLIFTADAYVLAGGPLTLAGTGGTVDVGSFSATITSAIGGTVGLSKTGAGTLLLNGTNTYTGVTAVSAGVLSVTTAAALGATGTGNGTTVADLAALHLSGGIAVASEALTLNGTGVANGGALRSVSGTNSWTGAITLGSASRINTDAGVLTVSGAIAGGTNTLSVGGAGNTSISGAITSSGTLAKDGPGTLTLTGANTSILTGPVSVTGGVIAIPALGNLGTTGVVTLDGGTLRETNPGNAGSFISATRGIAVGPGGGTVDYSPSGLDYSFVSIYQPNAGITITGPGNTLTKTGVGEFRFNGAGTGITTYAKLVVNQGLFRLGNVAGNNFETGFGAAPAAFSADAVTLNGGSIGTSYDVTLHANRGITLGANGGIFNTSAGALTVPAVVTGPGTLFKGAGTLTLQATNTYAGGTTLGGTLSVAALADGGSPSGIGQSSNAAANLVLNGGTLAYSGPAVSTNRLFSITSAGGTLNTSGTGAVNFTNTGAILATDKAVTNFTVNNTSTFALIPAGSTPLDLAGIAVGMTVTGAGIPAGTTVSAVAATLSEFTLSAAATATNVNTPLTFGSLNRTLTLTGTNTDANTLAGALSDSPTRTLGLTKTAAGTWVLAGANTYTGTTAVNGGILRAGATNTLSAASALTLANTAGVILDLNGFNQVVGSLAGGGTTGGSVTLGAATLTAGGNNTSTTFDGVVSGTGGLTKAGTGVMTLSAANTYTGVTSVNAGTLLINGNQTAATGTTTVASGATLGGTGTVGGPTTVNDGATIRGGASGTLGTLTVNGNVTAVATTTAAERTQVTFDATTASKVQVNGTITFSSPTGGSPFVIDIQSVGLVAGTPYTRTITSATGGFLLNATPLPPNTPFTPDMDFTLTSSDFTSFTGTSLALDGTGTNLVLSFTPVPEPATVLGVATLGFGLLRLVRHRRNSKSDSANTGQLVPYD